jgi:hypothetical protein
MYLLPTNQKVLAELLHSTLWLDVERCLMARRPPAAEAKAPSHEAAACGHQRAGFEKCLEELRKLPIEEAPVVENPFEKSFITDTKD